MKKTFEKEIHQLHANFCQALADPKRILILYEIVNGNKSVSELAASLGLRQANISQHLMVLRERGLVVSKREGTSIYYSLANPKIIQALDLLREVLAEKLEQSRDLAATLAAF